MTNTDFRSQRSNGTSALEREKDHYENSRACTVILLAYRGSK